MSIISLSTFAVENSAVVEKSPPREVKIELRAGDYLVRSSREFKSSILLGIGGSSVCTGGAFLKNEDLRVVTITGGVALCIVSLVKLCNGITDLEDAGHKLNESQKQAVVFKPANEGLGLNITF
jgi:hypothetical protein